MTAHTGYFKIGGGRVELHQSGVEAWHKRSEREMLNRSHPGPSGVERELERKLWEQVAGKELPSPVKVTPELAAKWEAFQASLPKLSPQESNLEIELFRQVASGCATGHQNVDSSHFPGKDRL